MEMMAALIVGRFGSPISLAKQLKFSINIFAHGQDIFTFGKAVLYLYASVGSVGRLFMEIG